MITLITGAPGAGKTNALVSLLAELAEGRALYVSGVPDLAVPHVVLDDPTKWHEVVEDGAAVVIDEVQRVWRPNRSKIPDDIAALACTRPGDCVTMKKSMPRWRCVSLSLIHI